MAPALPPEAQDWSDHADTRELPAGLPDRHLVCTALPVVVELGTIIVVLINLDRPAFLALFCAALFCYAGPSYTRRSQ